MHSNWIAIGLVGVAAGVLAGMFGIGGGIVIVPGLILAAGLSTKQATGTSLAALVPPTGILGAIEYYKGGLIDLRIASIIAAGIVVGAYFGAKLVLGLDPVLAKRVYAGFLILMGARMLLAKA